jgi:hypothetical protein
MLPLHGRFGFGNTCPYRVFFETDVSVLKLKDFATFVEVHRVQKGQ